VFHLSCIVPGAWGVAGGPEHWSTNAFEERVMTHATHFAIRNGVQAGRMTPNPRATGQFEEVWAPLVVVDVARALVVVEDMTTQTVGQRKLRENAHAFFNGRTMFTALRDTVFAGVVSYFAGKVIDGDAVTWRDLDGAFVRMAPDWTSGFDSFTWDKYGMRGR
jgi:hypothetical protein